MKFDSTEVIGITLMVMVLYCIVVCISVFRRKPDEGQSVGKPKTGLKWIAPGQSWAGGGINVNGAPMVGDLDVWGNPYGTTGLGPKR